MGDGLRSHEFPIENCRLAIRVRTSLFVSPLAGCTRFSLENCIIIFMIQDPRIYCKHCSLSDGLDRWAWHNAHITRKIAEEQRITRPKTVKRKSRKTGLSRKRPVRPNMSLKDELSNLHLLLRVPSFSRWPLRVRFFCEDVYSVWQQCKQTASGSIRAGIKVLLDLKQPEEAASDGQLPMSKQAKGKRKREALGKGGIEGLDVGYSELKNYVEKSAFFLAENKTFECAVCGKNLCSEAAMVLICPQEDCKTTSHMTCLATKFIEDEGAGAAVTPISGRCPGCKEELQWIDLIKELSLRARGKNFIAQMIKKPKERNTKVPKTKNAAASQIEAHTVVEEDVAETEEDLVEADMRGLDASDESLPDDWQYQDEYDDDMISVSSGHSALSDGAETTSPAKRSSNAPKLPAVIEDSDLDDAELFN